MDAIEPKRSGDFSFATSGENSSAVDTEAHAALGQVLKFRLSDLARANDEYARAVQLAPGDTTILIRYARFKFAAGPCRLGGAGHRACGDTRPLAQATYHALARALAYAGRTDEALAALRRARTLAPADPPSDHTDLAFVQWLHGDTGAAQATCAGNTGLRDLLCLA